MAKMLSHWDRKEIWIKEALEKGGEGGIYCIEGCTEYKKYGYGSMNCQACREAWRRFPGKEVEYYNNDEGQ